MNTLWQDFRYGIRMLFKNPGFTAAAALTLALGMGANTTIFSAFNAIALRPVPVPDPDSMARVHSVNKILDRYSSLSHPDYADYRDQATSFADLMAFADIGDITLNVPASALGEHAGAGTSEPVSAWLVSGNYFDVLRSPFAAGRGFLPEEDATPGTHPVVILSYPFWQRKFGADPSVVGKSIVVNGRLFTVVGVAGRDFRATRFGALPDVWLPLTMQAEVMHGESRLQARDYYWLQVEGRLKPGITRPQAEEELAVITRRLDEVDARKTPRQIAVLPASLFDPGDLRGKGWLMTIIFFTGPGLLLLIACANVGNLLLAKGTSRTREMAIRLSLGATRLRLLRQLITESLLLSLLGGAGGLLISLWLADLLVAFVLGESKARMLLLTPDVRVGAFVLAVSLLTPVLFGLAPALRSSGLSLSESLKLGGGQNRGLGRSRLQSFFVASQVALSVVLLIVAGLLVRTLHKALTVEPGIELKKTVAIRLDLRRQGYGAAQAASFMETLSARLRSYPAVKSVGAAMNVPASGSVSATSVQLAGDTGWEDAQKHVIRYNLVSPTFFEVTRLPIVRGRTFSDEEAARGAPLAVVTEAAAHRLWRGQDPIGQRYRNSPSAPWVEVIGVVPNVRNRVVVEDEPEFYQLLRPTDLPAANVLVRTEIDPRDVVRSLAAEVRALDRNLEPRIGILVQSVSDRVTGEKKLAILSSSVGCLALLLTIIGLYGVVAFSVGQRTTEIGVRMALGARAADVLRLVILRGLRLVLWGTLAGLGAALMVARALTSLLFDVKPGDPVTFVGVSLLLGAVAILACYLPARRATKVDPMVALRYE